MIPTLKKMESILVSACASIHSRYCFETSCMDSSWKKKTDTYFFSELSPLVKLRPFEKIEMNFCKCHIWKSIKARNFGQLIGDDK